MDIDTPVLVCGGQGNLGSWLSRHFLDSGRAVTILTRRARLIKGLESAERLECDLTDAGSVHRALRGRTFSAVIHAAGHDPAAHGGTFQESLRVNVLGTRHLLEALTDQPPGSFVYISTFQVYGRWSGIVADSTPPAPVNDYGLSRLMAEEIIRMHSRQTGHSHAILRLSNSYGCPTSLENSQWRLLFNDLARQAWQNGELVLRSDGQACRDFIWMGDVCRIVDNLMKHQHPSGITMNVSRGKSLSLLAVAEAVKEAWWRHSERSIAIQTASGRTQREEPPLEVQHNTLNRLLPDLKFSDRLEEEAEAIFTLLGRQNSKK